MWSRLNFCELFKMNPIKLNETVDLLSNGKLGSGFTIQKRGAFRYN